VTETRDPRCAHDKVFIVDDDILITGSMNLHSFSSYNVAEVLIQVRSKEAVADVERRLVEPRLRHAYVEPMPTHAHAKRM